MIATVNAGWTPDKGRDEVDVKVMLVGNDPIDVEHLNSIADDVWSITPKLDGATVILEIKATRKVPLAQELAAKAKAEADAEAKAQADAKAKEEADRKQADEDARITKLATAAAAAAVRSIKKEVSI